MNIKEFFDKILNDDEYRLQYQIKDIRVVKNSNNEKLISIPLFILENGEYEFYFRELNDIVEFKLYKFGFIVKDEFVFEKNISFGEFIESLSDKESIQNTVLYKQYITSMNKLIDDEIIINKIKKFNTIKERNNV